MENQEKGEKEQFNNANAEPEFDKNNYSHTTTVTEN